MVETKDSLVNKLLEFFNEQNYLVKAILKNLKQDYEYYVIYGGGEDIMLNDFAYQNLTNFERENKKRVLGFYEKNIVSEQDLIDEFKSEGYEIIFKKNN